MTIPRHTLRHQMAIARWSFRRRGWHRTHKRLARLRHLYWVLLRWYETETCEVCGGPVRLVFHVPDELWMRVWGSKGGLCCPPCFSDLANSAGLRTPFWSCGTEGLQFPQCDGSPCAHEEAMMVVAKHREECWDALVRVTGSREAAVSKLGGE